MFIQDKDLKLDEWEYKIRYKLPYEIKLELTYSRICEFKNRFDTYISFSGGIDSTVLLHFIRRKVGADIPAVFCDTGLEFPEIREFVKDSESIYGNIETIRPEMPFDEVVYKFGYPFPTKEVAQRIRKVRHGNLSERYRNYLLFGDERGHSYSIPDKWRFLTTAPVDVTEKCCDIMKKKPFGKYNKQTGRYPFIGITQDESMLRNRQYALHGCNVLEGKHIQSRPLGFWTRQDILRYAYENNIEYCRIYGDIKRNSDGTYYNTGEQRTGCMYCLFGVHLEDCPNRIQRLAESYPKMYDYIMRGGKVTDGVLRPTPKYGLGYRKLQNFLGVDFEPVEKQLTIFDEDKGSAL